MAQALLHLHVGGNLVERHVPRPLDHHLHAGIPRALRELADFDELGDLGGVACIVDATGAHRIAKGDRHVMLVQNGEHVIVELVERVLVAGRLHPGKDQRSTPADDVRETPRLLERVDDPTVHARMHRHEVDAVFGMRADDLEKIIRRDVDERLFQIPDGIVHGHRAHHCRRTLDERTAKCPCLSRVREVHDRLGTQLERDIDLAPLLLLVGQVARNAEVDVDLGAQWYAVQARTHALGIERGVVDVRRNGDASGSDGLAHAFRANALLRGDASHLLGHDSGTRIIDLRYLVAHGDHGALPSLALPTQVHRVGVTSALSAWITQAPRSWFGIICQIRHGKLARAKFPR